MNRRRQGGLLERLSGPKRILVQIGLNLGVVLVFFGGWQLITVLTPSVFFPPPTKIFENSIRLFFTVDGEPGLPRAITVDTAQTLWRMLVGFLGGALAGIVIGTVVGRYRVARETTEPVVEFLRSIPATATLPLFIILLGADDSMRVAFIAWGVTWLVLINTASGVSQVEQTAIDMGRVYRLSTFGVLTRIILPAASPKIFAGLRLGLTAALLLAVVSEFFLAQNGIGYQLIDSQARLRLNNMWSWILLLAVLGLILNTLLEVLEYRLLRWDRLSKAAS